MGRVWGIVDTLLNLRRDGLVRPPARTMRYRRAEYAGRPFYQWWYFVIKDLVEDRYFAFHLNPVDTVRNHERRGTYLTFSMVEKRRRTRFHRTERHPLESFEASSAGGGLRLAADRGASHARIVTDQDADHLTVSGALGTPAATWFVDGTFEGVPATQDLPASWDLTIDRIYGWYGEHDIEAQMQADGLTMWNTYAHTAEVRGTITVGDRTWTIEPSARYRAYCDMNWGSQMLHGTPKRAHPWGWFYAGRPWEEDDEGAEVAIIAGTGRSEDTLLEPLLSPLGLSLAFEGKFADVELGGGRRAGAREVEFFRRLYRGDDGEWYVTDGLPIVRTASDGGACRLRVARDRWTRWVDRFGEASFPRSQLVQLSTGRLDVTMHFTCEPEDCNRLLFPQEDAVFSDFEALGATCHVMIVQRDRPGGPWRPDALRVLHDFVTNDAGLEFGYLAPGSV